MIPQKYNKMNIKRKKHYKWQNRVEVLLSEVLCCNMSIILKRHKKLGLSWGGGVLNEVICFYKLGLSFVQSGIRDSVHVTRLSNKCTIYNLQFLNRPKTAVIWLLYCRYGVKHYPINRPINSLKSDTISLCSFLRISS